MKFASVSLVLLLLPAAVSALTCGGTLTKACLGEKDKRYDPKASNALKDQAPVWNISGGFFSCEQRFYDGATGLPIIGFNPNPLVDPNTSVFPAYTFNNITYAGSRGITNRITVYESVTGGGEGDSLPLDGWATSSYEKDGNAVSIGAQIGYGDIFPEEEPSMTYAVDDRTIYASGTDDGPFGNIFISEVYVCLDAECSQLSSNQDFFMNTGEVSVRISSSVTTCNKLKSGEAWLQDIQDAYDAYNVPEGRQVPIPMEGECFTGACPTEEDWCRTDPECSESPYKEPGGSVESGAIAGFTVLGIVLLIAALYGLHVLRAKQQERRYKAKFSRRIADTISLRVSMRQLTPTALASEFKKIDSESPDGTISKEGLWKFLSTGKAGELSESDFNALFAAIDLDQSGTVDFLEFCTFMGKCSDEFRSARGNRGSVADRASRRISVADTTARRLSTVAPGADDAMQAAAAAAAAAIIEEEGGADEEE